MAAAAKTSAAEGEVKVGKVVSALSRIDAQVPGLTYLGFAFWIAWNNIAFSGTGWLYDQTKSFLVEELMTWHLGACIVASLLIGILSRWILNVTSTTWFSLIGTVLSIAGTAGIILTRFYAVPALFYVSCICSGVGTTILFIRGVPLFGALPPRQALLRMLQCVLAASVIFFIVSSCPEGVDGVLFALTPLFSFLCYSVRFTDKYGEEEVLHEQHSVRGTFVVFIISIAVCGISFDLIRTFLLVNNPPATTSTATIYENLITIFVLLIIGAIALLSKETETSTIQKIYPISVGALAILLAIFVAVLPQYALIASICKTVQSVFNMTVWLMLAYIVYQSKSSAVFVFSFGNLGLCFGTLIASWLSMTYYDASISHETIRLLLGVLCICVFLIGIFVFSEKRLSSILVPIKEERLIEAKAEKEESVEDHKGMWMQQVEALADEYNLTPREKVVFIATAKGRTPQQIADHECVSIYTVRTQVRSIHIKLGVHSRAELDQFVEEHFNKNPR